MLKPINVNIRNILEADQHCRSSRKLRVSNSGSDQPDFGEALRLPPPPPNDRRYFRSVAMQHERHSAHNLQPCGISHRGTDLQLYADTYAALKPVFCDVVRGAAGA